MRGLAGAFWNRNITVAATPVLYSGATIGASASITLNRALYPADRSDATRLASVAIGAGGTVATWGTSPRRLVATRRPSRTPRRPRGVNDPTVDSMTVDALTVDNFGSHRRRENGSGRPQSDIRLDNQAPKPAVAPSTSSHDRHAEHCGELGRKGFVSAFTKASANRCSSEAPRPKPGNARARRRSERCRHHAGGTAGRDEAGTFAKFNSDTRCLRPRRRPDGALDLRLRWSATRTRQLRRTRHDLTKSSASI